MSKAIAWILGGLGFVLGGPIGAIVGALIGSFISADNILTEGEGDYSGDSDNENRQQTTSRRRPTQGDIRVSLLVLIACVMKADGHVKHAELDLVKRYLLRNYGEQQGKEALQMLRKLLATDINVQQVCAQISDNVNYSVRLEILHFLLDIAHADDDFAPTEQNIIEIIAGSLLISQADYNSLLSLYQKKRNPLWMYEALEITPDATNDEVKKAYRRMAMKYHPDKVASAGEDIKQKATEKFRGVQEAYETICTARGIK